MSDDYCLTITLSPSIYNLCPDNQLTESFQLIINAINTLGTLDYTYCIEETKNHNLHYHFYIVFEHPQNYGRIYRKIKTMLNFYDYKNIIGFIKLKTCFDKDNWLKYMHKNPYILHGPHAEKEK